jgi:outer membrane biosynthesis protein TonB
MMRVIGATGTASSEGGRPRRWFAALLAFALHGGLLVVVFTFAGPRAGRRPHEIALTEIVVVAAPPAAPVPRSQPHAPKKALTGMRSQRGHDAPQRSLSHAPAVADPFADLSVGFEAPVTSPDPGTRAGVTGDGTGTGVFGTGTGAGAGAPHRDPVADLRIPAPPLPAPSLARPPRPRYDYSAAVILGSRKFSGATVKVHLDIDARGVPHDVKVVQHVDDDIDRDAINQAQRFRFEPALDDDGQPAPGGFVWSFVIRTGLPTAEVPDMCLTPQISGPPLRLPCPRTFAPTRAREDRP